MKDVALVVDEYKNESFLVKQCVNARFIVMNIISQGKTVNILQLAFLMKKADALKLKIMQKLKTVDFGK